MTESTQTAPGTDPVPIEFAQIADRQRPSSPRISPDGSAVVTTVSFLSTKKDRAAKTLWMIRGEEASFPFTGGLAGAGNPDWSPDGKQIVFTSKRDNKDDQDGLFVIPASGGEAQQLGDIRGDISLPFWSPDGTRIAFLMPDPETEEDKRKKKDKQDHIVVDEEPKHQRLWVIDAASGSARALTTANRSVRDYCWAPDGKELVIVSTPAPTITSLFLETQVARVPASGGVAKNLVTFPTAPEVPVVREVDGQRVIALIGNDHRADPSPTVWLVPWEGGSRRALLPNLRGAVSDIIADPTSPDGLLAVIVKGTHARIHAVSISSGETTLIATDAFEQRGTIEAGISASHDGSAIACVWSASDQPDNAWKITRNGTTTRLTSFGKEFDNRLARGETVRWSSFDGVEIEGTLIRPHGAPSDDPVPLFVQVHGGPAWQWEDAMNLSWHDWAQMLASRGWAVLLPNPRGSTGYGSAFEKLLQDDVGGGESRDLVAGADALVARGIADPDRLAIGGWSWGGYLTARTITQTTMFKAAVMGAGVANLASDHGAGDIPDYNLLIYPGHPYDEENWEYYSRGTPIRQASKVETPTLILHGDSDDRVHPTQGQEYYHALKRNDVPVRFVRYPREGHQINEREHQLDLMERICEWLETWVPAK